MTAGLYNEETGETYTVGPVTKIGRLRGSDVQLADPKVSRQQAMIRFEDGAFWIYDLGSFNGTTVNGNRLVAGLRLHNGDEIGIAGFRLRFLDPDSATPPSDHFTSGLQTMAFLRTSPAILLVSDVKGFTQVSERLAPDDLARLMGSWYRACEEAVRAHGGAVDKFIGDAMLACWMNVSGEARSRALDAARSIVRQTGRLAREAPGAENAELSCGAALHLGMVAHGGMGGGERTIIGDTVNVAFRLQDLTRALHIPILVSKEFLEGWETDTLAFQPQGSHSLKGRAQPVEVWATP